MVCKMVSKLTIVGTDGRDQSLNMGFMLTSRTTMRDGPMMMPPLPPTLTKMTGIGGGTSIDVVATIADGAVTMAMLPPPPSQGTAAFDHTMRPSTGQRSELL
jgi:hypothetical protein